MSLLSDEQIGDILDICNVCASGNRAYELIEWSKKQKPVGKFEPDWSGAPEGAVKAIVNLCWVFDDNNWSFSSPILATYDRPKPVNTPHPHAALMMKYAEVAQRRTDPWVEFEYRCKHEDDWEKGNGLLCFYKNYEYRYAGEQ